MPHLESDADIRVGEANIMGHTVAVEPRFKTSNEK